MLYGDLKTYLLARRHLVTGEDQGPATREESDEVSNRRLTSMAADIGTGLAYLSQNKFVHRDLACRFGCHKKEGILKNIFHFVHPVGTAWSTLTEMLNSATLG